MSSTTPSTDAHDYAPTRHQLVTVKQFAAACNVSAAQVRRWVASGQITEYRIATGRTGRVSKYSEIRLDLNEQDRVIQVWEPA